VDVGVGVGMDVDLVPQDTANIRQKLNSMARDRAAFFVIEILISVLLLFFLFVPTYEEQDCS
jgi:hypothetical protein